MLNLNNDNYKTTLNENKKVLIDFWAEWCMPCKILAPELELAEKQIGKDVLIAKVNIDESVQIAIDNKVEVIPTLILFVDGKEVARNVGVIKATDIENFIKNNI